SAQTAGEEDPASRSARQAYSWRARRTMRRIALRAALLAAMTGSGCSTMGPAAMFSPGTTGSGFSYGAGRAVQSFGYAPTAVQPAVLAAMDDLRIQAVRQTNYGSAIVFEGT